MGDRSRAVLLFGLVVLALVGAAWFQVRRTPVQSIRLQPATTPAPGTVAVAPTSTPSPLSVYVSGAVWYPDVYALPPGSIVKDALLAAGGASDDADLDRINLAARVADGQHVYIPHLGEPALTAVPSTMSGVRSGAAGALLNINTATPAELEALPGIGPSLAARIVADREEYGPFAMPEDIIRVPGIGPATFEKIRDLITTN